MKLFLITIVLFLVSGCSTIKPSVTEYRVITKSINSNTAAKECRDKSLKVAQAFSSPSLMSLKMDYVEGESRVFSYSQAQWQESPNNSVTSQILKNIRDANIFKSVQISKSRSKNSLILETSIGEFMQFYSEDMNESYVKIVLSLTLVNSKTATVVSTKTFSSKVKSKTLDAKGGVEALNTALSEIISQNIEWLVGVCK